MTRVALKEAQKRYLRTLSDRLALTDTDNCLSVECAGLLQVLQDLLVIPSRIPYIRSRHWLCFDRWVWLRRCKKNRRGYFAFLHICTFCSCLVKKIMAIDCKGILSSLKHAIYNKETKEILGRTVVGWGE